MTISSTDPSTAWSLAGRQSRSVFTRGQQPRLLWPGDRYSRALVSVLCGARGRACSAAETACARLSTGCRAESSGTATPSPRGCLSRQSIIRTGRTGLSKSLRRRRTSAGDRLTAAEWHRRPYHRLTCAVGELVGSEGGIVTKELAAHVGTLGRPRVGFEPCSAHRVTGQMAVEVGRPRDGAPPGGYC